jgi:Methylamine utilisation protein MauE
VGSVHLVALLVTAGTFAVAAVAKAGHRDEFAGSLVALRLVRPAVARTAAAAVIAGESALVLLCLWPPTRVAGLVLAALAYLGLAAVALRAARGPVPAACRCFGVSGAPLGRPHAVRNAGLAAVAVLTAATSGPAPGLGALLVAATAAFVLVALVAHLDDLTALVSPVGGR